MTSFHLTEPAQWVPHWAPWSRQTYRGHEVYRGQRDHLNPPVPSEYIMMPQGKLGQRRIGLILSEQRGDDVAVLHAAWCLQQRHVQPVGHAQPDWILPITTQFECPAILASGMNDNVDGLCLSGSSVPRFRVRARSIYDSQAELRVRLSSACAGRISYEHMIFCYAPWDPLTLRVLWPYSRRR